MKITDNEGKEIAITDLEKATEQAQLFSSFEVSNDTPYFVKLRKVYWKDILHKLEKLQDSRGQPK